MSLVREENYTYAFRGHYTPKAWEEFSSHFPEYIVEVVGQYSEDTPNVVYFEFESESGDDYHAIVFLLSDDDYALVPTVIELDGEEDSTSYLDDWVNNATSGDYTSIEDVPAVESQGYYEGWSLASGRQFDLVSSSRTPYTIKDNSYNLILGFNATWQVAIG